MERFESSFRRVFRETHRIARRLLRESTLPRDQHLRGILEYALASQTASEYPFVFRAAFSRLEEDGERVRVLGGAVHLLQSAAFITDDIFDESELRYGAPAIHVKYDVNYAVLAAELFEFVALEAMSRELARERFESPIEGMHLFHRIARELYLGQYLDVFNSGNTRMTTREYYRVIRLGVGNYFSHLAKCGAMLGGKSASEVDALARFGYHYGMALFITDDVVDVLQTPEETGKSYACDLRNRRMRLPILVALERGGRADARALRRFLKNEDVTEESIRDAAARIGASGAPQACLDIARRHLGSARTQLAKLPAGYSRESLDWLAATLIDAQQLDV